MRTASLWLAMTCMAGLGLAAEPGAGTADARPALSRKDYSFSCWLNGWRKQADDPAPDLLCVESGRFGFALDLAAPDKPRFALFNDDLDYLGGLEAGVSRLAALAPAELQVELEAAGKTWRMTGCRAGASKAPGRLSAVRLWESGRWVQHYDVLDPVFQDAGGARLACTGLLDLVAWPDSLTFNVDLAPSPVYENGPGEGVVGSGLCVIDKPLDIPHDAATDPEIFTVECWVKIPESLADGSHGWLLCKNSNEWQDGNFGFELRSDSVIATLNTGGGRENQHALNGRQKLAPDAWNHLALSYDGKTMRFILNGNPQGAEVIDKKRVPGKGLLRIGKRADTAGKAVPALYDQVRIWSRALPPEEIKGHAARPGEIPVRQGLAFEENFEPKGGGRYEPPVWTGTRLRARFKAAGRSWESEMRVPGAWRCGDRRRLTLNCDLDGKDAGRQDVSVQVRTPDGQSFPVTIDPARTCHVAEVRGVKRAWKTGYTDIRNYDELLIAVENKADADRVVSLLVDLTGTANVTGLCPVLCDEKGVPTGLPVQLSKNWHYGRTGDYLRAFLRIPARPGASVYRLRVVYGFYGTLPSASHAQLSLIGYGGNGRWDQLAIGCWGETFCLDMDMSLTEQAITDVRCLMVRKGANGTPWSWTDGGWGGDWLCVNDGKGRKLCFSGMKTAYLAHGPCLTDVRYHGHYGPGREVDIQAAVQTLRTDDYARTFHRLRYTFRQALPVAKTWLFKMGRTGGLVTPKIAYGDVGGLTAEKEVPETIKPNELFLDTIALPGSGPWWIAFPGARLRDGRMPDGSRALIIRGFKATFGGRTFTGPRISMPAMAARNLDLLIVPPKEVAEYKPGDTVDLDLEWITLPRAAEDYYGPNEAFRRHLADHPSSWKTVYREARGNDLNIKVDGGAMLNAYPVVIRTDKPEVRVAIRGGVGFVPIRFEGLPSTKGRALYRIVDGKDVKLDQSVHGNDFWQTDYDAGTRSFKMSFNLPLDGLEGSTWGLKTEP